MGDGSRTRAPPLPNPSTILPCARAAAAPHMAGGRRDRGLGLLRRLPVLARVRMRTCAVRCDAAVPCCALVLLLPCAAMVRAVPCHAVHAAPRQARRRRARRSRPRRQRHRALGYAYAMLCCAMLRYAALCYAMLALCSRVRDTLAPQRRAAPLHHHAACRYRYVQQRPPEHLPRMGVVPGALHGVFVQYDSCPRCATPTPPPTPNAPTSQTPRTHLRTCAPAVCVVTPLCRYAPVSQLCSRRVS